LLRKRSINIYGHKTSISIEKPFWDALKEIAKNNKSTLISLIQKIDESRNDKANLSSSIRIFVLNNLREKLDFYSIKNNNKV
tara:strand:+ start:327 stop:572 length:246 start_codon:yes stop_codon:yes gene_type:complete